MVLREFRDLILISGGQTGVDRAALDLAIELGLPHQGWCPAGRWAEDGTIPQHYRLKETPSLRPEVRTEWNVRDSDGTLILARGEIFGGTAFTKQVAEAQQKPHLLIDLSHPAPVAQVRQWILTHGIRRLNVAGPRESHAPGIYAQAKEFLRRVLCDEA